MVTLEKILYKNYMNVVEQEVILSNQGLVLVVGENGSGKSTLFVEGPYYALYGRSIKYANPVGDKIVNERPDDSGESYVHLWFSIDNVPYEVIRVRKSSKYETGLSVFSNGVDLSRGTSDATQEFLNDLIGMGPASFTRSVIFSSRIMKFPTLKDSEKKEVFDEILQLEVLNEGLAETRKVLKELKESKKTLTSQIKYSDSNITLLSEELVQVGKNTLLWESGRKDRLRALEESLATKEREMTSLEGKVSSMALVIKDQRAKIDKKKSSYKKMEELIKDEQTILFNERLRISGDLRQYNTALNSEKAELKRLNNLIAAGKCGTCFQATTGATFKQSLAEIEGTMAELSLKIKKITAEEDNLNAAAEEIDEAKKVLKADQDEVDSMTESLRQLLDREDTLKDELSDLKAEKAKISQQRSSESTSENPHSNTKLSLESRMASSRASLAETKASLAKVVAEIKEEEVIEEVLGPKGARLILISASLPLINAEAEKVQEIMGTHISVNFKLRGEDESYGGTICTEVFNPRGASLYEGDSDGEQRCIDWIMLLSMLALVSSRGKKAISQAFYDEVFDTLSAHNKLGVLNVIKSISQSKNSIFILSHDPGEIGGQCDKTWTVAGGKLITDIP